MDQRFHTWMHKPLDPIPDIGNVFGHLVYINRTTKLSYTRLDQLPHVHPIEFPSRPVAVEHQQLVLIVLVNRWQCPNTVGSRVGTHGQPPYGLERNRFQVLGVHRHRIVSHDLLDGTG